MKITPIINGRQKQTLKKDHFLLCLFMLFTIVEKGCTKFVQVNPPVTTLVTTSVFNNDASATSAQLAIYIQMVNNWESWTISQNTGLLGDELTNYTTTTSQVQLYTNSMTSSASPFGPWINAYKYIYQANAIIENLRNPNGVTTFATKQLTGEAEFIRAFWFFYLVNCYGDIPLAIKSDYSINAALGRSSKSEVYQQIIADLSDAKDKLNASYVDVTDTIITTERVRPTKGAAAALLARVYLYNNKFDSAEAQATEVINNSLYKVDSPLTTANYVFKKNDPEAIWQLSTPLPAANNGATMDGQNYILTTAPNNVALSLQLLNSFEAGDARKVVWIGSKSTGTPANTYYFPSKYKTNSANANVNSPSEYIMVLRLSEQYLIRAEARAQEGNLLGALNDLNVIRNRAMLANYAGAIDQTSVLAAILHERQVELFTEWGNRWFDLNRTGTSNTVMGSPGNVCKFKGGTWSTNWQLYPIPISELTYDPNLTENPGY